MSEEDTFNRLRRTPFRELFIAVLDPIELGTDIVPGDRRPAIEEAGWDWTEFMWAVGQEMAAGAITGNTTRLRDAVWREEFLKRKPIY